MIDYEKLNPQLRAAIESIPVSPQITYGNADGAEVRYNFWTHALEVKPPPAIDGEMRALGKGLVSKGVFTSSPFEGPTRAAPPAFLDFLRTLDHLGWVKTSEAQVQEISDLHDAWNSALTAVLHQYRQLINLDGGDKPQ